jgi:hypothetical protein
MKSLFTLIVLVATIICNTLPQNTNVYTSDYWIISDSGDKYIWIEIHNREEAQKTGIAHISVLSRLKSGPVYEFKRIYAHLAITTDALQKSVIRHFSCNHGGRRRRLWRRENGNN